MPLYCEITEIPLPVNCHRNSSDGDRKLRTESSSHAESNDGSGDLPRMVMASDRAPEVVNPSTADQRQNDVPSISGLSEMAEGNVRNKTQVMASPETSEITANWAGDSVVLQRFNRWLSDRFPAARTTWIRSSSLKLQIGTNLARNGGRKWETDRVKVAGRVGSRVQSGQLYLSLSLSCLLSLPLWSNFPPLSSYRTRLLLPFIFYLSLIQIKLIPDPRRK